ncbi:MAG TPA: MFS transporter, partial [Chitinophagaceae bacterium]
MPDVIGKYRWTICALLFFATTVNYLDRQVLSLLEPYLADPRVFNWSNTDYANITAAFQFVYAFSLLIAGHIVDKFGTKRGYSIAIIIWSVAAITHAFAIPIGKPFAALFGWIGITTFSVSVLGFMFSRSILAFGEAGNFPAAIKAVSEYFPKKERSFATGVFNSGTNIGAILAPLTVPWIRVNWGWEAAFIIMGILGFLWLIFWLMLYEKPEKQKRLTKAEFDYINSGEENASGIVIPDSVTGRVPWRKLLDYPQTWAFTFGKFMTDGVWWFFLFWLPNYLKVQYNVVDIAVMLPLAVLYTLATVGSICGGWFPIYFI